MVVINFNPRSREGSDPRDGPRPPGCTYFNPRSREGSDLTLCRPDFELFQISIHAPVKGATRVSLHFRRQKQISIHAPVKGATQSERSFDYPFRYFNPRSREGSDPDGLKFRVMTFEFQSTLP